MKERYLLIALVQKVLYQQSFNRETGEINLLEENLNEINKTSQELKELYNDEHELYEKMTVSLKGHISNLDKIRNESSDPNIRLLAHVAALTETLTMGNYSTYMSSLNIIYRQSIYMRLILTEIDKELSQLKHKTQVPLTEMNTEKIEIMEKEVAMLVKEFKKYSPILKDFKRELDDDKKYRDKNK